MTVVLDSWAILRLLEDAEPGASRVQTLLDQLPVMSWVSLGEVAYVVHQEGAPAAAARFLDEVRASITLDVPSPERVRRAAELRKRHGMAYAESYAAATAIAHDATLVTGDPGLLFDGAPWRWEDLRRPRPGGGSR